MVTIKDIARVSGVSHGTVSNVLNKKGNVSAAKIKLVEETAKKLGYNMNSQAQFLR
ncbi:LacI family DNA-binding transcriptional regulator, partial [Streptococcus pneumoniae]|nr:LacI family DNA-binding transcriptional regulator [Streptococcus pneumoniae]